MRAPCPPFPVLLGYVLLGHTILLVVAPTLADERVAFVVETPAAETECDRLAASPGDLDRPSSIRGVAFEKIDPQRAIPACRIAVDLHPDNPRLAYTMGRALDAAKQYDEAVFYYRKAADAGYVAAISDLGTMYRSGLGVAQDEREAARLFHLAADAGNTFAMNNLGYMYQEGLGVAKDDAEALRLYRKAVDAGSAEATSTLGVMNENGRGVAKDEPEAARLDRKAADDGKAEATIPFGKMYETAHDATADDATPASQAERRPPPAAVAKPAPVTDCDHLAASPDDPDRPSSIPGIAFEKIDSRQAIPACQRAVDSHPDDPRLVYTLGRALDAAKQNDEAIRYYRKAVDSGYGAAMNNLATKYRSGNGVARDAAEAVRLYRKAADAGNARAMLNLGRMYRDGNGVAKDAAEAARLVRKAADAGNAKATSTLGMSTTTRTGRLGSLGGP